MPNTWQLAQYSRVRVGRAGWQCLDRRILSIDVLREEIAAWQATRNQLATPVAVSAISVYELSLGFERGRITLNRRLDDWIAQATIAVEIQRLHKN